MKRLLAITLAMVMALALFAGCAAPAATEAPAAEAPAAEAPAAEAPAAEAPAAEAPAAEEPALKVFHTYMSDDVPMLNGHDTVEGSLNTVHDYCSAPLYKKIPSDSLRGWDYIGVCASELPIQIDEHNWQIKIREEACWQNGDPINADTFMYSYKMLLDPILANQMANFLADYQITIVNAPEYMLQGTANTVAWEDVGIKKVDDYTIQITTVGVHTAEQVASNFLDRSVYPVYEPLYEAGMNADRTETTYGTTLDMWMGAGAYYFDQWEYDNIHVYKKNPNFWQADLYNYDQVEVRIVPEMNARVELFEQGLLDSFTPDANTIDAYIDDPRVSTYKDLTVYHIDVNCKNPNNPISGNVNYRKALYHAIDREVVAEDLFGHMEPTGTYISWAAGQQGGDGTRYRETEYGLATTALVESWGPYGYNPELALEYFNKACEEEGVGPDEVIKILFTCEDTSAAYAAMGEFFQQEWPKIFDGRVEVEIVTYAGMSATAFKKTGDDKWDLSPNDWTSGTTRTYPHACFMYYLESYGSHPNNYFDKKFEEMFAELDVMKNEGAPYEEILKKTQALEEHYLDVVIHIPIVQDVAYDIFNDKLILPVDEYVPSFGWGTPFGDFEE